jgi:spore maturation protein CgeB
MKIFVVTPPWIGGLFNSLSSALKNAGNNLIQYTYKEQPSILRRFKVHNVNQIRLILDKRSIEIFNLGLIKKVKEFEPDLFISINEAYLLPEAVSEIKKVGCFTINFVSDNPFDPLRFSFFPITLKYYKIIFVFDRIWIPLIRNVAPKSKVIKLISGGAFDPALFYPEPYENITEEEKQKFSCDLSFTGESYNMRGEAGYRSDILEQLNKFNVKIWGDSGWEKRFKYYPGIKNFYQGERLSYDQLRKLYSLSTINLNIPSPQIFTGFQPRTFEIAACKGFQIADWREEFDEWFADDELVSFRDIPDLMEKTEFFLKNPDKRIPYIEKLFKKVSSMHTWEKRAIEIMEIIKGSS